MTFISDMENLHIMTTSMQHTTRRWSYILKISLSLDFHILQSIKMQDTTRYTLYAFHGALLHHSKHIIRRKAGKAGFHVRLVGERTQIFFAIQKKHAQIMESIILSYNRLF